jgi:hypothetical protein
MDLIKEAKNRGYRKGTPIKYVPHAVDYVEGDYFEIVNGNVLAFKKPKHERKSFDDERFDTLYNASKNKWVEIADLQKSGNNV